MPIKGHFLFNGVLKVKLSVIVAAYNVEKEIKRCLQSLHIQTMQNVEFLWFNR